MKLDTRVCLYSNQRKMALTFLQGGIHDSIYSHTPKTQSS